MTNGIRSEGSFLLRVVFENNSMDIRYVPINAKNQVWADRIISENMLTIADNFGGAAGNSRRVVAPGPTTGRVRVSPEGASTRNTAYCVAR